MAQGLESFSLKTLFVIIPTPWFAAREGWIDLGAVPVVSDRTFLDPKMPSKAAAKISANPGASVVAANDMSSDLQCPFLNIPFAESRRTMTLPKSAPNVHLEVSIGDV